jgi:hypothetical protein
MVISQNKKKKKNLNKNVLWQTKGESLSWR